MAFGYDPILGYISPTFDDVLADFRAKYFAESGVLVDLEQPTPSLDLLRTLALIFKEAYDDQAGTYASAFVATSTGAALQNLLSPFIGAPLDEVFSSQVLPVTGTPLYVIPAGSSVLLDSDGATGLSWTTVDPIPLDGVGFGSGTFVYAEPGPKSAAVGTWTITTPQGDWLTAGPSLVPAVPGRLAETPLEYRQRYTLAAIGQRLFAAVSSVPGVTSVAIFENQTDIPDVFWGATHWIEVLVLGGTDADIAAAIQKARCFTVQTLGDVIVVTPAPGFPGDVVEIRFSRPTPIEVWTSLVITKGEGYPADVSVGAIIAREDAIRTQILDWGAVRPVGLDVTAFQIGAQAFQTPSVPGIADIETFVGLAPAPVTTVVIAGDRDLLVFAEARIALTGV